MMIFHGVKEGQKCFIFRTNSLRRFLNSTSAIVRHSGQFTVSSNLIEFPIVFIYTCEPTLCILRSKYVYKVWSWNFNELTIIYDDL